MKKSLYLLPLIIVMLSACGNKQADVAATAKADESTVAATQKDDAATKDSKRVEKERNSREAEDIFMLLRVMNMMQDQIISL